MSNALDCNKASIRSDYEPSKVKCIICLVTGKQKSRTFNSHYALRYHLTTSHSREDEISAGVTRRQILQMLGAISKAIEWNMLVEIPKEKP